VGAAPGAFTKCPRFLAASARCFREHLDIIQPRRIIAMGDTCQGLMKVFAKQKGWQDVAIVEIMHPSTRALNWKGVSRGVAKATRR
jgi:hypothetical protein